MIKAVLGDYVAACSGDMNAGILLNRMTFLCEHSKFVHDNKRWYIRSREEALRDTGLTKHRYDAAFAKLKELEYVEVDYTQHGGALRKTMFRVTERAIASVLTQVNARGKSPRKQVPSSPEIGLSIARIPGGHMPENRATNRPEIGHLHYSAESSYDSVKITDPASRDQNRPQTAKQLEAVFREGYKKRDPNYYHGTGWTNKNLALAKRFLASCGEHNPGLVVWRCVIHWDAFAEELRKGSTFRVPERPDPFTLLTQPNKAVQFALQLDQQPGGQKAGIKTLQDL